VKGGHLDGDAVVDTLVVATDGEPRVERFSHPRVDAAGTHGSGCTLSSAIAARLARGSPLIEAVVDGVAFMEQAVRYGIDAGTGPGAVHHLVDVRERADYLSVSDAVESVVARLVDRNVETLVPAVGMAVVGASRFAPAGRPRWPASYWPFVSCLPSCGSRSTAGSTRASRPPWSRSTDRCRIQWAGSRGRRRPGAVDASGAGW